MRYSPPFPFSCNKMKSCSWQNPLKKANGCDVQLRIARSYQRLVSDCHRYMADMRKDLADVQSTFDAETETLPAPPAVSQGNYPSPASGGGNKPALELTSLQ